MKKNKVSWVYILVGVSLCSVLFSFAFVPGAHSVQVYLDSKLVIDQYINFKNDAPKLTLDAAEKYSQLIVKYNECGRTVTGRKITLKDNNDKVLKDWRFEEAASGFKNPMSCPMKEILALRPKGTNPLKLYYSSNDFPEGYQIAYLVFNDKLTTASN